jgi:phytoene synthase
VTAVLESSYEAARAVTRHHAKSFFFASVALPSAKRRRAYAVYAFCRHLDDVIDRADSAAAVTAAAEGLQAFVRRVCGGAATEDDHRHHAWLAAFLDTTRACEIPSSHYLDLLHGVCLDRGPVELRTEAELRSYCYYVAGVVGLMMTRIFGLQDRTQEPRALALGEAMQLTNILRDVAEDLRMGRVYLPGEELERFGIDRAFLERGQVTPEWREFMRFQIGRARASYATCEAGISALPDDGSRRTVWLMRTIYAGILDAIEAADMDVFSARRSVPFLGKCCLAAGVWFRGGGLG